MGGKRYILASGSPRRRELLSRILPDCECIPSGFQEGSASDISPVDQAMRNALGKASEVGKMNPEAVVIAADTLVVLDDTVMGKPRDLDEAVVMLKALSGRTHQVITGVAVIRGSDRRVDFQISDVTFRTLGDAEIESYVRAREPLDKAGAYGIQEIKDTFLADLDGDYDNVMGLPTGMVAGMVDDIIMSISGQ